jgi:preprotein translocase subunit SecD
MDRSLRLRTILLVVIFLFCVATLIPSVVPKNQLPSWFNWAFSSKIALGTDIAGGARFVYSIDLDKAIDDKASEIKRNLETIFLEDGIKGTVRTPAVPVGAVTVVVDDATKRDQVDKLIVSNYGDQIVRRECAKDPKPDDNVPAGDPPGAICIRVSSDYAEGIKKAALTNAVSTIRERIDRNGIAEPSVIEKGDDVIVELPGLDDEAIERIKKIIAQTAKLEFKVVLNYDPADPTKTRRNPWMRDLFARVQGDTSQGLVPDAEAAALGIKAETDAWTPEGGGQQSDYYLMASDRDEAVTIKEAKEIGCWTRQKEEDAGGSGKIRCPVTGRRVIERWLAALGEKDARYKVPECCQLGFENVKRPDADREEGVPAQYWRTYYLERAVQLTGSAVSDAGVNYDPQTGQPQVLVDFNRYGGRVFGDLTAANVGRKVATILNDEIKSAPIINQAIRGGRASITMGGSNASVQEEEAKALVSVLTTGSLPAPLREESASKVGPTLGRDAVDKAKLSFGLGILLVIILMVGIYKWSGWIAVISIVLHTLLTLAVMALFGATLTLPGIAAVVLSVGMVVDGNILIYERIRDELNTGKSVRGAVDLGFTRAFSAILDGQLTIAAAGWVLLQYGSGPIKGFAVMLLVGVFTTLLINVWVTRICFDWYLVRKTRKQGQMATISI